MHIFVLHPLLLLLLPSAKVGITRSPLHLISTTGTWKATTTMAALPSSPAL